MSAVAFLGTGTMGLPMAGNLIAAGYSVHAWNRSPARARPLERDGAEVFDDPAAGTRGCPHVVTMLADVEAVLETATQALTAADADTTWIPMSTIGVKGTGRCRDLARERGVTFVDAPVLGTRAPAEQGKLIILASAPEDARAGCEPIFDGVGARTEWLGEAGAGTRLKVVINGWLVGVVGVLAETITVARALGVDPVPGGGGAASARRRGGRTRRRGSRRNLFSGPPPTRTSRLRRLNPRRTQLQISRSRCSERRSSRETCICEMPTRWAISVWVRS
jgi:3-hydroxyisobutyrate dehydrogenase